MSRYALSDADVRAILRLLSEAEDVTEFRLRYGDLVIELRNPGGRWQPQETASTRIDPVWEAPIAGAPSDRMDAATEVGMQAPSTLNAQSSWTIVRAPAAGIFRCNRQPRTPAVLVVGRHLPPRTVIGVVETADSSNPIPVDAAGIVRAVLVEDGEPVEAGQALVATVTQGPAT